MKWRLGTTPGRGVPTSAGRGFVHTHTHRQTRGAAGGGGCGHRWPQVASSGRARTGVTSSVRRVSKITLGDACIGLATGLQPDGQRAVSGAS